ncbi:hypothetical protein [uncultured Microbacterium sp.]|nr:hypothetical protein [uncultured Microbacterium sp.]
MTSDAHTDVPRLPLYPRIDVDPDFHVPPRRTGAWTRLLIALRILPQAS